MNGEEEAFLRALIASPEDAALRGVYADWLEERGDSARGEFLRLDAAEEERSGPRWRELRAVVDFFPRTDPGWPTLVTTLGRAFRTGPQSRVFVDVEPASLPFGDTIGCRGRIVAFRGQFQGERSWSPGLTKDVELLVGLPGMECAYGAADMEMHPFLCEVVTERRPLTGSDVLAALKARDFRSRHIPTLEATRIAYPGYHPSRGHGIDNDEIHNDFARQYLFPRPGEGDAGEGTSEGGGTHGLLRRSVYGHLWYVLLHVTPQNYGGMLLSPYVVLFAVGLSLNGDRLIGAVTHQVCHNLCD
jgi:uncharacterized protein (TIGR02996 family)